MSLIKGNNGLRKSYAGYLVDQCASLGIRLNRAVSRQRLWQLVKKAQGRCIICGQLKSPFYESYCLRHAVKNREAERKLLGYKKRLPTNLIGRKRRAALPI